MTTPSKVVISLPRRPDEDDIDAEGSRFEQDENRRSSWVDHVTPLKTLVRNQRRRSSFGGVHFQEKCKLLRELCSPDIKRGQQLEHSPPLLTPRSGKEDALCVYERFEILLNVLRVERHKEKTEAEKEILALRNKIATLEKLNHASVVNDCVKAKARRKSLGAITNILPSTSSLQLQRRAQDDHVASHTPKPSPSKEYEQKIIDSVKKLMEKESQFEPDMDRRLLAWYLDEESSNLDLEKERMELQQQVMEEYDLGEDEMPLRYFTALKEIQQQHDRVMDEVAKNSVLSIKLEEAQEELRRATEGTKIDQDHTSAVVKQQNVVEKVTSLQMKGLQDEMSRLQGDLKESKRNHTETLMKLAVESTQKASLSIKLEEALSQIEKQQEMISLLNEELGKARYECDIYSTEAHQVLEESKQLLVDDGSIGLEDISD